MTPMYLDIYDIARKSFSGTLASAQHHNLKCVSYAIWLAEVVKTPLFKSLKYPFGLREIERGGMKLTKSLSHIFYIIISFNDSLTMSHGFTVYYQ